MTDASVSPTGDDAAAGDHAQAGRGGIEDLLPAIEAALQRACNFGGGCPDHLATAMRYALLAPGKRLRPALVLMAAEACGGRFEEAMPAAVAVEMVHAYSLIHDDLPAMDDDDLRRGRPTVHVKFGEATAILAGDALLAQAFAHLSSEVTEPIRAAAALKVLSHAAGPCQLVGGQADDLAAERQTSEKGSTDELLHHLETIHRRKTGALFAASLEMGGLLSGATSQQLKILGDYAREIGLAFQVVDDLLDYTSDAGALGKRTGKDADRGKLTYPGLLGVDAARQKARSLVQSAQQHVSVFGSSGWRLSWLASYVLERTH